MHYVFRQKLRASVNCSRLNGFSVCPLAKIKNIKIKLEKLVGTQIEIIKKKKFKGYVYVFIHYKM